MARRGILAICIVLALAFAVAGAQQPDSAAATAARLRVEADANAGIIQRLNEPDPANGITRNQRLVATIDAALAATSRTADPLKWGSLQISRAIALNALYERGAQLGDLRVPALRALDAALATLSRETAPLDWARAQRLRGELLDPGDAPVSAEARAQSAAALRAALSVYTREAYPLPYLEIRCRQVMMPLLAQIGGSDDRARKRAETMLGALSPSCPTETFTGDLRAGQQFERDTSYAIGMMVLVANENRAQHPAAPASDEDRALAAQLADMQDLLVGLADGAHIFEQMDAARTAFFSATLALDELGLSPDALRSARALRARIDELEAAGGHGADYRANAPLWEANARLVDLLATATPSEPAGVAASEPMIALFMLGEGRGVAASQRPGSAGSLVQTAGLAPWLKTAMGFIAATPEAASPRNAVKAMRDAHLQTAVDWMRSYSNGDVNLAIADFRRRFEPAWSPVLREIANATGVPPGGRLVILPDGAASMLPIGLLRDRISGRALIEDYEIAFAPSVAAFEAAKRRAALSRPPALAFAAPPLSETGLSFVDSELALAGAWFPGRTTREARKGSLLTALRQASYWHFATHGAFDAAYPRRSALLLEGGDSLRLSELLFSAQSLGDPRLVVLSACETGLFDATRDPDQFIGLPTGFLQVGAAGVIASLWPVADAPTALLMGKMYERHLDAGERPSAALRHAQLWLKNARPVDIDAFLSGTKSGRTLSPAQAAAIRAEVRASGANRPYADPSYWGAFVYYGA